MKIEDYIISVPDFPKPGVLFRDITGILGNADALKLTMDSLYKVIEKIEFDVVAGLEARGFLFGMSVAERFHKPFVPVRKKGKLPRKTVGVTYDLEYGSACIEIHKDAIKPGDRVVLIDDLLATGGTAYAAVELVKKLKANVIGCAFVIELTFLNGKEKLKDTKYSSIVQY